MMGLQASPKLQYLLRALLYCGIAISTALLAHSYRTINPFLKGETTEPRQFTVEDFVREDGFNFNLLLESGELWNGPKVGERIDASMLRARDNKTLADALQERELSILVAVDPACATCARSTEYMQSVRDDMTMRGGSYYVVTFVKSDNIATLFNYADSLNLNVPSFSWDNAKSPAPVRLEKMFVPAHLLIDRQQIIRAIWPGGSPNPYVGSKMALQIKHDMDKFMPAK